MNKKYWLPFITICFLFSIFFVKNISTDDGNTNQNRFQEESCSLNNFGEEESACIHKESFVDLNDFEEFLSNLGNKALHRHSELYFDTTGDGSNELVKETVTINEGICEVNQEIYKDGRLIWENTIELNETHMKYLFRNKEVTENIEDYALFYLGLTYSPFIEKMEKCSQGNARSKIIIRNHLKDSGLSINEMYLSNIGKRIMNYKGYFIFKRNPGENSIYMWDEKTQEFMQVYKPNKELT